MRTRKGRVVEITEEVHFFPMERLAEYAIPLDRTATDNVDGSGDVYDIPTIDTPPMQLNRHGYYTKG